MSGMQHMPIPPMYAEKPKPRPRTSVGYNSVRETKKETWISTFVITKRDISLLDGKRKGRNGDQQFQTNTVYKQTSVQEQKEDQT